MVTHDNLENSISKIFVITEHNPNNPKESDIGDGPVDFETAITKTEFGKFNVLLLLIAIPSTFSPIFDTTTMSYIIPISKCDLNLSLENMGMLNSVTYIGMISSGFIWGFLADTMGRKKLLIFGYLMDAFFVILCGFSQEFTMLIISKFMTGLMINGPFAVLCAYMNEFNSSKYRILIPLIHSALNCVALICLPLLGWTIFSEHFTITIIENKLVLKSWNVFLIICSLPSLISSVIFTLLPETPKFLMSMGKNDEALKVFQMIYSWNTGKDPKEFPVKQLVDEIKLNENNLHGGHVTANRNKCQALKEGWQQLLPLFYPPYLSKVALVFSIQFGIMWCANTLRLWFPQLFAAINDYQKLHGDEENSNLCDMLEFLKPNQTEMHKTCVVNYDNSSVYINNIIVWVVCIFVCLFTSIIIRKVGKRAVLVYSGIVSGVCVTCIYFTKTEAAAVTLSSLYTGFSSVLTTITISIVVDIFPTTIRTMTVALTMMSGRTGAMIGNLTFPILLSVGCLPPFLSVGCFAIGCALFAMLLPRTDTKPLE